MWGNRRRAGKKLESVPTDNSFDEFYMKASKEIGWLENDEEINEGF